MKNSIIKKHFPINSQTSNFDKKVILNVIKVIKKNKKKFNYLEIGSFLGGSLTPFLSEKNCQLVMSIDKRNQKQDDERNEEWSYKNIDEKDMINKLEKHGLNTSKLKTFNGDIQNFKSKKKFDLSFIDGIHTDVNTFSDFLNVLNLSNKDSIVLFHDSSIIFKSISIINILLLKQNYRFKLAKFKNSEITGIFFGKYSTINLNNTVSSTEKFERFCELFFD